jgi:hypothetical protein
LSQYLLYQEYNHEAILAIAPVGYKGKLYELCKLWGNADERLRAVKGKLYFRPAYKKIKKSNSRRYDNPAGILAGILAGKNARDPL